MSKPQTAVDILRAARKLIEKEENWTQGEFARDDDGDIASEYGEEATCFCDIGAVRRAAADSNYALVGSAVKYLALAIPNAISLSVLDFARVVAQHNDNNGHAENLTLFDKAITLAERDHASAS